MKLPVEVKRGSVSLKVAPVVSPLKSSANVMFIVDEDVEGVLDSARPTKHSRFDFWNSSGTATSVEGATTDIRLSGIDSLIGRCASGRFGPSELSAGNVQTEMPLREEITVQEGLPQRSKYYPIQSAKTLLKDFFFAKNPPNVLNSGLTTTSVSADQTIYFARAVGLEVTSYGFLKDLLLRARGVSDLGVREQRGRLTFST